MNSLPETVHDIDYLLALEVEELASLVLHFARRMMQNGLVHLGNFQNSLFSSNIDGHRYSDQRRSEIELAIAEAWSWLEVNGFLVTAPGINGTSGFRVLSRRAKTLDAKADLKRLAQGRRIEKSTLHPRIAETVWSAFMRGEFDLATFHAMKTVEIYVREAGGFGASDIGVDLMRAAFHDERGPLTDKSAEKSERQARAHLFAGAIGSYKNALSHRDINIDNPDEAIELVMLANHLLRIVDARAMALKK